MKYGKWCKRYLCLHCKGFSSDFGVHLDVCPECGSENDVYKMGKTVMRPVYRFKVLGLYFWFLHWELKDETTNGQVQQD
jgi:hypothetical protein